MTETPQSPPQHQQKKRNFNFHSRKFDEWLARQRDNKTSVEIHITSGANFRGVLEYVDADVMRIERDGDKRSIWIRRGTIAAIHKLGVKS